MVRFPNLKAEMARNGVSGADISSKIGVSQKSFSNKLIGKTEFTRSEMIAIQSVFEQGFTIEYLFETPAPVNSG